MADLQEDYEDYEDEETAKVTFTALSWEDAFFRHEKEFDTEIPLSDWDEMTDKQKNDFLEEFLREWQHHLVEVDWK